MKSTIKLIKELNIKLVPYNLELERDVYSKKVKCFCTTLKQNKEQLWNIDIINIELAKCKDLKEIKFMPYFK